MSTVVRRKCQRCGKNRAVKFFKPKGRICSWCQKSARKVQVRHLHVTGTYGLTVDEYESLKRYADGTCHGCFQPRAGNLCVDHDHRTGKVRGLLCRRCNRVLGLMRDDHESLKRLSGYLVVPPASLLGIAATVDKDKAERPRRNRRQWK